MSRHIYITSCSLHVITLKLRGTHGNSLPTFYSYYGIPHFFSQKRLPAFACFSLTQTRLFFKQIPNYHDWMYASQFVREIMKNMLQISLCYRQSFVEHLGSLSNDRIVVQTCHGDHAVSPTSCLIVGNTETDKPTNRNVKTDWYNSIERERETEVHRFATAITLSHLQAV